MNICFVMEAKQRGGGWIQPRKIGQHRVEIGIFQLKIKNGYLILRIPVQAFEKWYSLKIVSIQN
jgi:hypothetical protein